MIMTASSVTVDDVVDLCSSSGDEVEFVGSRRVSLKKRKRRQVPEMQRGSRAAICLNDVDQKFDNLTADHRTDVLFGLFSSPRKHLDKWRIKRERHGSTTTLWGLVVACWEDGNAPRESSSGDASFEGLPASLEHSRAGNVTTASAMAYMARRLVALRDSASFDRWLSEKTASSIDGDFSCCVCMEEFLAKDLVFCGGDEMHAACRPCFNGLCTKFAADKGVGSAAVSCPDPSCSALFSRRDVVACVSPIDIMRMDERERESSVRTGLGGTVTLRCACGAAGTFAKDESRRVVDCPSCSRRYCLECGHYDHGSSPCPPPADGTDAWIAKKTKPCPNCKEAIEKNAGCAHMTCRCGHQFCWNCLGPFPNCHCGHFEEESRREALRLQMEDSYNANNFTPPMPHLLAPVPQPYIGGYRRIRHRTAARSRATAGRRRSRRLSSNSIEILR